MVEEENRDTFSQCVAIIGMAGRFPGADSVRTFWKNLVAGADCLETLTDDQLRASGVPEEIIRHPACIKRAGVLEGVDLFDAAFFGYSPREAELIDPQQRLILECAWEAIEDAGYVPETIQGLVGVFAGSGLDYYLLKNILAQPKRFEDIVDFLTFIGNDKDYISSRISYKLGFQGPSFAVQSACSTSLVAVQLGYQALLTGQCDLALSGGIALQNPRARANLYTEGEIFSKDGTCRTFDKDAGGMVFGEGMGLVVLKRLEEALADRDHIYAVIRGAAVNNDGSVKAGFTAPSPEGQAKLISLTQELAGVTPDEIDYIEAHGTATKLGDAIEITALTKAFRKHSARKNFCGIGSVKTNIGHLDAAAGVTGLIKTAMALEYHVLPASLHYKEPNPELNLPESPFFVVDSTREWPAKDKERIAGVSSFGMGGTNAHVILQEAPRRESPSPGRNRRLFLLSARSPQALDSAVHRLKNHVTDTPGLSLADAAYTLQIGRRHFRHRFFAACESREELMTALETQAGLFTGRGESDLKSQPVVFMFPGQGAQYPGMMRSLYARESVVRQVLDAARAIMSAETGEDLFKFLFPETDSDIAELAKALTQTRLTQPFLVAVEYALARLWMERGILPSACIGHSIGEYTAAIVAGVLGFEEGFRLVIHRGILTGSMSPGVMLTVPLSESELTPHLTEGISLSLINAPQMTVVGGSPEAIERWAQEMKGKGVVCKRIRTSHAFHSSMMDEAAEKFVQILGQTALKDPAIPLISNVTGDWVRPREMADPTYWGNHLRKTVRFSEGAARLLQAGFRIFLELGPGQSLSALFQMHASAAARPITIPTVGKPDSDEESILLKALGELWIAGAKIDWRAFHREESLNRCPLPTYPFERKRFWIDRIPPARYHEGDRAAPQRTNEQPVQTIETKDATFDQKTLEKIVLAAWIDVLRIKAPDPETDFLSLGGNSLMLSQVAARLNHSLPVEIPLAGLMTALTVNSQVRFIQDLIQKSAPKQTVDEIQRLPRGEDSSLSPAQQRLWFICQLAPDTPAFNLVHTFFLHGNVDHRILSESLQIVVNRHEALRTVFSQENGVPRARVLESQDVHLDMVSFSESDEKENETNVLARIKAEAPRPFDLSKGPLHRSALYKIGINRHIFAFTVHHLVSDGWSMSRLLLELSRTYSALARKEEPQLPELEVQYLDYAAWMNRFVQETNVSEDRAFWKDYLQGELPVLQLPTDISRPAMLRNTGGLVKFDFSPELTDRIHRFAQTQGVTVFSVLLSLYGILLRRYANQESVIIGCPSANRLRLEFEPIIGLFLNMVPLKMGSPGEECFGEYVKGVHREINRVFAHQKLQFGGLVETLQPQRVLNQSPIFQTMFAFNNYSLDTPEDGPVSFKPTIADRGASEYDLSLYMWQTEGRIQGALEYSDELFKVSTVQRMAEHFSVLSDSAVQDAAAKVSSLPLLTEQEKRTRAALYETTAEPYPREIPVHDLFAQTAEAAPERIAITDGHRSFSYSQVRSLANQVSRHLLSLGVVPGECVGVRMTRTIELLPALWGVLGAGAAYVPLDPMFPAERLDHMIQDAGIRTILADSANTEILKSKSRMTVVTLDKHRNDCAGQKSDPPDHMGTSEDLAYVLYTSGSTGKPKGVEIKHRSLVNFLCSMRKRPGLSKEDTLLALTTISFDIAGLELFLPLAAGARIFLVDGSTAADGFRLKKILESSRATIVQATPATWRMLLEAGWKKVTGLKILCGGEALSRDLADRLLDTGADVWNMYGPTETTIWSSIGRVKADGREPDLGLPIANTQFYLLDANGQTAPRGVPAELCIGGDGLARGYRNLPDLTAEKFAVLSIDGVSRRIYRTGDSVRERSDGTLEFIGRQDRQVKIRGFRIELKEIEACIGRHPSISQTVVSTYNTPTGKELVAYVQTDRSMELSAQDIRSFISTILPSYMIPATVLFLSEFPLTPNGKIDRLRLPAPGEQRHENRSLPSTPQFSDLLEAQLLKIWEMVLGKRGLNVDDDYFDLGGNSLTATRLFAAIEKRLHISLPLATLYSSSTISKLANTIRNQNWHSSWKSLVPIQTQGNRPPLFLVHGAGGNVLLYRGLAHHLGGDYPVYGLQARGLNNPREAITTIEDMAAAYLDEIKSVQSAGPYFLGGYCMGGQVAFEIARQLEQKGEAVGLVALMSATSEWVYLSPLRKINYYIDNILFHLKNITQAETPGKVLFIKERGAEAFRRLRRKGEILKSRILHGFRISDVDPLIKMEGLNDSASKRFHPQAFHGTLTLFNPKGASKYALNKTWGWDQVKTAKFEVIELQAFPNGILVEPYVRELAELIRQRIDKISAI